jgi:2,4-didehydro-3-deoxy-L-rhamnonate hydrolase
VTKTAELALGTFSAAGSAPFGALVVDDQVLALNAIATNAAGLGLELTSDTVLGVLDRWDDSLPVLRKAAEAMRGKQADRLAALSAPIGALRAHPPVNLPRQVFCTGMNYRGHVAGLMNDPSMRGGRKDDELTPEAIAKREEEMEERAKTATPYCFSKLPTVMIGATDPLTLPAFVQKPDWELELGVVIGRRARNVSAKDAMDYVAGYAIINDITAREFIFRPGSPVGADWLAGKNMPGFAPFGPYLVPSAFVKDPYDLNIRLAVNGKVYQDESTSDMLINIARQIEWLSKICQLMPGDVIATGSPAGNGSMYGVFLKPGDVMEASITGLGTQRTPCIAEA